MENFKITNVNFDAVKYFVSIARHGSLSRAAASLGLSQSALSQSMKSLEESLGVVLFNRNSRGIILTEEGRVLYEQASLGVKQFNSAVVEALRVKSFSNLKTFKVAVSTSIASLIIAPIIKSLKEKFPQINFEFCKHIYEGDIVDSLQEGKYDLVIIKCDKDFITKKVEMEKLLELNYTLVYDSKYFDFKCNLSLEELANYTIVMKDRTGRNDNSWVKFSSDSFVCCRNDMECLSMIKNGGGIGFFPKELAEKEGLEILRVKDFSPTKRVVNAFCLSSNQLAIQIIKQIKFML